MARALLPFLGDQDEVYGYTYEGENLSNKHRTANLIGASGHKQEQGPYLWKHSTAKWVKKKIGTKKWKSYFKFSVVRNPYDIYLSLFHWWKKSKGKWDPIPTGYRGIYKKVNPMNFDEYICSEHKWDYTLLDYLTTGGRAPDDVDEEGNLNIGIDLDLVGRYDSLRLDFSYICGRIGLPNLRLYRENESRVLDNRRHVSSFLKGEKARSILLEKHALELDYFEYDLSNYNEYAETWEKYMM